MNCQKLQQMALIKTAKNALWLKIIICFIALFVIYTRNLLPCLFWNIQSYYWKWKDAMMSFFCESSICASFLLLVIYYTQWVFSFCAQSFVSATIWIVISKYVSQNSICILMSYINSESTSVFHKWNEENVQINFALLII